MGYILQGGGGGGGGGGGLCTAGAILDVSLNTMLQVIFWPFLPVYEDIILCINPF